MSEQAGIVEKGQTWSKVVNGGLIRNVVASWSHYGVDRELSVRKEQ